VIAAQFRVVFEIEVKAGGVSPSGRELKPEWTTASASGYCSKLFKDGAWPPVFKSKHDALAACDLIREASPNIVATRIVQKRHPANRTLWPKANRILDTLESLVTDTFEEWTRELRTEFATHAVPLLEGALDSMRGVLAKEGAL